MLVSARDSQLAARRGPALISAGRRDAEPRTMKCPRCQAEVSEDSKSCPHCAAPMHGTTEPAARPPDVSALSQQNAIAGPPDLSGAEGDSTSARHRASRLRAQASRRDRM